MVDNPTLNGYSFGKLTVLHETGRTSKSGCRYWECICECGKRRSVAGMDLVNMKYTSCGRCNYKYKEVDSEYNVWSAMMQRCYNENNPSYHNYGGRGIKVCERWHNYSSFIKDIGNRPKGGTLDRINNNGNYEPKNCRWVDMKTQQNNRRNNRIIVHNGKEYTVSELARIYGVEREILFDRVLKYGWSVEDAISTPIRGRLKNKQSSVIENQY